MREKIKKSNIVLLLVYLLLPVIGGVIAGLAIVKSNGGNAFQLRLIMTIVVAYISMNGYDNGKKGFL